MIFEHYFTLLSIFEFVSCCVVISGSPNELNLYFFKEKKTTLTCHGVSHIEFHLTKIAWKFLRVTTWP